MASARGDNLPMVFDYSSLPREFKRHYLPQEIKFDWDDLKRVFEELGKRPVGSSSELELWLLDEAELDAYIYEQRAIRYFNSTRQTDNPEYTKAYEEYTELLEPKIKLASFEILKKYMASPFRAQLPGPTYGLEDRRRQSAVAIFREENVALEKDDSALSQRYFRTTGAMTVTFRGQERTLQQMSRFLEEPDRGLREEAWRLSTQRALADSEPLDSIYTQMVALRDRVARNAGFDNYRDYTFVKKDRFDYSPEDCEEFHRGVEESMVPLSREIDRARAEKMGVDVLRPWDLAVDPAGRPALRPFEEIGGLVSGAGRVMSKVDGELSSYFGRMVELQLLDLDSRKGKAPGGYQEELAEARFPFIFMNATGKDDDVRTLLHESGHSFHTFLMRKAGVPFFNGGANMPSEFAEVASMSMEMITGEHYEGTFYNRDEAKRSNWREFVDNVKLFTWVATVDAFQHWVYTHPVHTRDERVRAWVSTFNRFCGLESYEGLESSRAYRWQRQLHIYEVPFYYIEYGIALTGAIGIWSRYRKDPKDAIEAYKGAMSLGCARPLPELFEAAGVGWGFGPQVLRRISEELRSAIREYAE
ncbi:MAG TPA: M3 family oligoendopeptidase [Nitrososphaerales archaeon]|nr:M3 family oligoendopeptidase [Nitrososphaerales archaeon]